MAGDFFSNIDIFSGTGGHKSDSPLGGTSVSASGDFFQSSEFLLLAGFAHGAQAKEAKDAASARASGERAKAKARRLRFDAQQKQARAEQRIRQVQEKRAKLKLFRDTRRKRANVQTLSESTGVGTGTSAFGAAGSIGSQSAAAFSASRIVSGLQSGIVKSNLELGTRAQSFLDIATSFGIEAEEKQAKAGTIGSAIGVAGKFFGT